MQENNNLDATASNSSQENQQAVDQLQKCQLDLSAAQEKAARLQADFENYKRRMEKDRAGWINSAQSGVLLDIITIADDFDRALSEAKKSVSDNPAFASWIAGFDLIDKSLIKMLAKYQVKELTDMSAFDPEKHEAIMQVESTDHESGDIVAVLQKGYMFKDTVLRPAKVSVAK